MEKIRKPLKRSFLLRIVLFILLMGLVLSLVQFFTYRSMLYARYEEYIENILMFVADEIDKDDMAECIRTGERSEKLDELQVVLDKLRDRVNIHFIYVIVPLNTEPMDNIKNVIAGVSEYEYAHQADELVHLNMLSGEAYAPETAKKYLDAFESGQLTFFEERSQWGDDYTGLLPLFDSNGDPVAALCVDVEIEVIHEELRQNTITMIGIIMLLGAIFAAGFFFWTERNVTGPIVSLKTGVVDFAAKCRNQKDPDALQIDMPEIRTGNEVEQLANAVLQMSEEMRGYVKSIAYTESELARMVVLANKDPLTSVRNKYAYDAYSIELETKMRTGEPEFAVLMADLNELKRVNDTYGHEKGDIYIKKCCQMICEIFDHSPVFRIGGDEFTVILEGQDYADREELLRKLRETFTAMEADETLEPWERCSVAIGCAEYRPGIDTRIAEMLVRADQDMYAVKEDMKGNHE